jgi:hypothetical protein
MTQDIRAASYALGQAETASAVPWNMWDAKHDSWLSVEDYPSLWTDVRGGIGRPGDSNAGGLAQQSDLLTGWTLDPAHQPDLSYVPYLMTGERWMLDNLQAQAGWNIVSQWPEERGADANLVVQGNQVRGAAWALRQIDEAAWSSPDGSEAKAYFTAASEANWSWIVRQIPSWTEQQGEAHGWLPGVYGTEGALPPWQQDYFASTAIAAARHGNADALSYLEWASNFLVGRFQHEADGFAPHDGAAYLLAISDPATGVVYDSWAEIGARTVANDWSNGEGWSHTDGDYAQLALATLAGIVELTGSQEAAEAYTMLVAEGAPFASDSDFSRDPTFAIAPPGGSTFVIPDQPAQPDGGDHHTPGVPATPPADHAPADPLPPPVPQPAGEVALSIVLGGQAWEGNPEAVVLVNGSEAFRGEVTASHARGGMEIALGPVTAGATHDVVVQFINDAWGGSDDTDRNLYVEDILLNGVSTGHTAVLLDSTDVRFSIPAHAGVLTPPAAGPDGTDVDPVISVPVSGDTTDHTDVPTPPASSPGGADADPVVSVPVSGDTTDHPGVPTPPASSPGGADAEVVVSVPVSGDGGDHTAVPPGGADTYFSIPAPAGILTPPASGPVSPGPDAVVGTRVSGDSTGALHMDLFRSQASLSGLTLHHADGAFLGAGGTLTGEGGSTHFSQVEVINFADGRLVFDDSDPAAQVMRLYRAALGREPDSVGQEHWTAAFNQGASLTTLAKNFMNSEEFHTRFGDLDDAGFIARTYQQVLGRAPDGDGMTYWQEHLSHGLSRADMLVGFSESPENREATQGLLAQGLWDVDDQMADIARLYQAVLDRAPDRAGLQFWDAKADQGMTVVQMANSFAQSVEFNTRFPGATDADFVRMVYENTLGRAGEPTGEAFWLDRMAQGATRGEVVAGFAESHEFLQLTHSLTDHGIVLG